MNYTLTQAIERTKDLSGEIKAARAHEADCAADHEAKFRIAEIAAEAHNKASGHCIALEMEREELANHIAALVRRTGDPVDELIGPQRQEGGGPSYNPLPLTGANPFDVFGGFEGSELYDRLLANGEAKLNQAFDEATR